MRPTSRTPPRLAPGSGVTVTTRTESRPALYTTRRGLPPARSSRCATWFLYRNPATVIYDDAKVTPDRIVQIIEKEGYKAEPQSKSKS